MKLLYRGFNSVHTLNLFTRGLEFERSIAFRQHPPASEELAIFNPLHSAKLRDDPKLKVYLCASANILSLGSFSANSVNPPAARLGVFLLFQSEFGQEIFDPLLDIEILKQKMHLMEVNSGSYLVCLSPHHSPNALYRHAQTITESIEKLLVSLVGLKILCDILQKGDEPEQRSDYLKQQTREETLFLYEKKLTRLNLEANLLFLDGRAAIANRSPFNLTSSGKILLDQISP